MAKSTERHKREKLAQHGEAMNISTTSIRKAGIVNSVFADGKQALMRGEDTLNSLYKLAIGDNRVGLHIQIPPELRERIKAEAKAQGKTVNELLTDLLTKIFWYE